jgi:hypothetical protein
MTLFLLNLRAWLGRWRHPIELRATGALYLRVLRNMIAPLIVLMAIMWILFILAILAHLPPAHRHLSPALLREALRFAGGIGVICGAFYLGLPLLLAITSRLFARRGERGGESTVYGRCFTVLLDPPSHFFARIGLTRETARWYGLPLDWDAVVEPSEAEFELTVLAGTGWVERLRRLGPASRVLTQPAPELPEHGEIAAPQAEDTEPSGNDDTSNDEREDEPEGATAEEKQTLRRFARRSDLGWRSSPANIACGGWALVVGGLLFGPGLLVFVVMSVLLSPRTFSDPGGRVAGITGMAIFFAIGLGCIIWGLRYLLVWRRVRRFRHEQPASVAGEVLCWIPTETCTARATGRSARRH